MIADTVSIKLTNILLICIIIQLLECTLLLCTAESNSDPRWFPEALTSLWALHLLVQ